MRDIENRIRTIKLIEAMDRHPAFSKDLGLIDTSHYKQSVTDDPTKKDNNIVEVKQWTRESFLSSQSSTSYPRLT